MRYPDSGGLSAQQRASREQVRLQAAGWFAEGVPVREVAARLRVSRTAVFGWQQQWRRGGESALASKGPGGKPVPAERLAAAPACRRPEGEPGGARVRR